MAKSLGDYNIERSSSSDVQNITWTKKVSIDTSTKSKKSNSIKISKNTSPTNIIFTDAVTKTSKKIFIIEEIVDASKSKINNVDRKFENSSASNCNIKQGFKRPSR